MAAITHEQDLDVPADWASRELTTFAYRSSIGHYEVVDTALEWNQADDCQTEGVVAFEPVASERTRMTVRIGYDPNESPTCETAVRDRVLNELADFKQFTEQRYRHAAEGTGADVA